jgi:hypothetical protein
MVENIRQNHKNCSSCGKHQEGRYCQFCGEIQLNEKHRSVRYILGELLESFTSLENRFIKSLASFFISPGELTRNYSIGKRIEYMKPITFFLLINLLYVLFTPMTDFNVSFYDQLNSQTYSHFIKPIVMQLIDVQGLDYKDVSKHYQQVTAVLSRSLIIISAPLFAMFIAIIYRRQNYYFADHLIFSIYIYAWVMVWIIAAQLPTNLLVFVANTIQPDLISEMIYFDLLFLGIIVYILLASRKAYQINWIGAFLRLPLAVTALVLSHKLYRLVQLAISLAVVFYETG